MSVQVYSSFDALPETLSEFLEEAGRRSFSRSMPYFRTL
jgi:hypothetical protein